MQNIIVKIKDKIVFLLVSRLLYLTYQHSEKSWPWLGPGKSLLLASLSSESQIVKLCQNDLWTIMFPKSFSLVLVVAAAMKAVRKRWRSLSRKHLWIYLLGVLTMWSQNGKQDAGFWMGSKRTDQPWELTCTWVRKWECSLHSWMFMCNRQWP